jgi:hypothetical protein
MHAKHLAHRTHAFPSLYLHLTLNPHLYFRGPESTLSHIFALHAAILTICLYPVQFPAQQLFPIDLFEKQPRDQRFARRAGPGL